MLQEFSELHRTIAKLDQENTFLSNALIKSEDRNADLENTLKQRDQHIAQLILDKERLKDLLVLTKHEINDILLSNASDNSKR